MILYYTGTGNSAYAAKFLALQGEKVAPMLECESIHLKEDETLGLVMPIYFYTLPAAVKQWIQQVELPKHNYVYVVLQCGGATGKTAEEVMALCETCGRTPDALFSLKMIDNYIPVFSMKSQETIDKRLPEIQRELSKIKSRVLARKTGIFHKLQGPLPTVMSAAGKRLYERSRTTRSFRVNEDCIHCGLCAEKCPEEVILMEDGFPTWTKEKCSLCLSCLHHCPVHAIDRGRSQGKKRYHDFRLWSK